MATTVHIYLFPYFLYPALSIAVTGSVYMTVAIAIGEIKGVCNIHRVSRIVAIITVRANIGAHAYISHNPWHMPVFSFYAAQAVFNIRALIFF
jgi:hypothetical protein